MKPRHAYPPNTPNVSVNIHEFPDDLSVTVPPLNLGRSDFPRPAHPRSSSLHLSLSNSDDGRGSLDGDRPPPIWSLSQKTPFFNPRARLHPIALIPAFILGLFIASSGFFSGSRWGRPLLPQNGYSISSSNSDELRVPTERALYTSHPSGHLFLNPASMQQSDSPFRIDSDDPPSEAVRHPIHDLIANATHEWEAKLKRQSKNLAQAVTAYQIRYGRKPPKGFDEWFKFAKANDVVLIDEFDNINRDILPFWAIPSDVLNERAMVLQDEPWTFSMAIQKGEVEVVGSHKDDGRAQDQKALMKRWVQWVPDVNITMSAHDGPSVMTDYETKNRHIKAAKAGKLLPTDVVDTLSDPPIWGFQNSCPNNSRLRRAYEGLEINSLPRGPSFVQDHLKTMDMCENPEWQYLHGFTAWPGMPPKLLQPLFSFAKTSLYSDILMTPLEQYWDLEPWDPEWDKKLFNKAVWRGSTTGVWFDRTTWWRSSQRVRLWFMSKDTTGSRAVRFDGVGVESEPGVETIAERRVKTSALMERYVDFAFTGKAGQCDEQDGSCDYVTNLIDFQPGLGWNQANEYKYLLDIDGNAWSGRFHRLLSSNSVVLKSTIFPEWYSDWIQPWVHYVPLKVDYTDLFDIMAFFSGDLEGRNGHEDLAKLIAWQGQQYAAKFWRYQDMEAYFFRLALEWARVTAPDRASMDYAGDEV